MKTHEGLSDTKGLLSAAIGKRLSVIALADDALRLTFADGTTLGLSDEAGYCCEVRYMRTDDDLSYYVGAELRGAEIREAPDGTPGTEDHDVQFLVIQTDRGEFTMSSHNEHNGYYGGFSIEVLP